MQIEDIAGLAVPGTYLLLALLEARYPAREFPPIPWWRAIGLLFFVIMGAVVSVVPTMIPTSWVQSFRLLDLSDLGIIGGVLIGWPVMTLVNYYWHRSEHRFNSLWCCFHQLHHSPQRLDLAGFSYTHPTEMVMSAFLSLFVGMFLLGLNPVAVAIIGYMVALAAMIQHLNMTTPTWIALLFQRPEAHRLHHERGVHQRNYSDFPLWDRLFGTYGDPVLFKGDVGFESPADRRVGAILAFQDVNRPAPSHGN